MQHVLFSVRRLFTAKSILALLCVFGFVVLSGATPSVGYRKGERLIAIYNIHTKETLRIVYKKNGKYIPSAMKKINFIMRDWRRKESRKMDPKLIDLMWEIHTELGSRKPIYLISGYRSLKTNNMLRRTRGGQARRSQHTLGRAADVHFPDISIKQLRYSALIRQRGGVGYYPTSAIPFVHLDTGRVRHWPRMPRLELAALFPNGKSQHVPSDGRSITRNDYRVAMAKLSQRKKRAILLAHNRRSKQSGQPATQLASLSGKPLGLTRSGKPVLASLNPSRPSSRAAQVKPKVPRGTGIRTGWGSKQKVFKDPTPKPTKKRQRVASIDPTLIPQRAPEYPSWSLPKRHDKPKAEPQYQNDVEVGWARAPSYDEEHPDELSYQPFHILPFMKDVSVGFDTELMPMIEPNYRRVENLFDEPARMIPLRFRPGLQFAEMLWASEFKGPAVVNLLPKNSKRKTAGKQQGRNKVVGRNRK